MPVNVHDVSGNESTFCKLDDGNQCLILPFNALLRNTNPMIPGASYFSSGRPNPSSEHVGGPVGNLFTSDRGEHWLGGGYFVATSETNKGYEFSHGTGGNTGSYNVNVTDSASGIAVNLDLRTTLPTTHFRSLREVAGRLQTLLRASILPSASLYVVTYSDEKHSSTAPTYKFTISHPTKTFQLTSGAGDLSSALPAMGWPATVSGASTYTSALCPHSEEYVVLNIGEHGIYGNRGVLTNRYRYVVFKDLNMVSAGGTAPGADKIVIYLGTTLSSVDAQPNSAYTEGVDMFHVGGAADLGVKSGTDQNSWIGEPMGATLDGWPCRLFIVDLYKLRQAYSSSQLAPTYQFMRIKFVSRTGLYGRLALSGLDVNVGWWATHNPLDGGAFGSVDASDHVTTPTGNVVRGWHAGGRRYEWAYGEQNPLTDEDFLVLQSFLEPRISGQAFGAGLTALPGWQNVVPNRAQALGARQVVVIDPLFTPTLASTYGYLAGAALVGSLRYELSHLASGVPRFAAKLTVDEDRI